MTSANLYDFRLYIMIRRLDDKKPGVLPGRRVLRDKADFLMPSILDPFSRDNINCRLSDIGGMIRGPFKPFGDQ